MTYNKLHIWLKLVFLNRNFYATDLFFNNFYSEVQFEQIHSINAATPREIPQLSPPHPLRSFSLNEFTSNLIKVA